MHFSAATALAKQIDTGLAEWIAQHVTFPSTMVDRIVPAVTPETLDKIEAITGVRDPAGVACEPFRQWVIEDNFVAGRPEWEKAGAELVADVIPFEEMKLRMLNGSHSFLAYLGYLAGYQHINDCMDDENYRLAARALMLQEQAPTLKVKGVDLQRYADLLIERYSNPALRHRTWQIAMDGSQKLPQRMLDSVRWHIVNGSHFDLLALGVAGFAGGLSIGLAAGGYQQYRCADGGQRKHSSGGGGTQLRGAGCVMQLGHGSPLDVRQKRVGAIRPGRAQGAAREVPPV